MPAVESTRPFLSLLIEGGTLILLDDSPYELITGSAAQLHRVNQAPRRFTTREAFDAFTDPNHEKLFMSIRVAPTGRPYEQWLVLEHAMRALSPVAERRTSVIEHVGYCWLHKPTFGRWAGTMLGTVADSDLSRRHHAGNVQAVFGISHIVSFITRRWDQRHARTASRA